MKVCIQTAESKYRKALLLYSTTSRTIKDICKECGVSRSSFSSYIYRNHRELMYRRRGIPAENVEERVFGIRGQRPATREKYRAAIEACDSEKYIEYNVSQIARIFKLDGTALANQLRIHYPGVIERREEERQRLGIADNIPRGVRAFAVEAYSKAVELLRSSEITIEEASQKCGVSFTGLRQHLLMYHKDIVELRRNKRDEGRRVPKIGCLSGNGRMRKANDDTYRRFAEAVELYRKTSMTIKEICEITGHNPGALRNHIRTWHKHLMFARHGVTIPENGSDRESLAGIKRFSLTAVAKYAPAVEEVRQGEKSVERVARDYGFKPEVFRGYLQKHYPEIWREMGMTALPNGRRVLKRSADKYAEAIEIYRKSGEPLASISRRLGLVCVSVYGFIRRNMPEVIEEHNLIARYNNK